MCNSAWSTEWRPPEAACTGSVNQISVMHITLAYWACCKFSGDVHTVWQTVKVSAYCWDKSNSEISVTTKKPRHRLRNVVFLRSGIFNSACILTTIKHVKITWTEKMLFDYYILMAVFRTHYARIGSCDLQPVLFTWFTISQTFLTGVW